MTENDKEPRLILVQGVGAFIMEDDKGKAAKAQLLAKDAIKACSLCRKLRRSASDDR